MLRVVNPEYSEHDEEYWQLRSQLTHTRSRNILGEDVWVGDWMEDPDRKGCGARRFSRITEPDSNGVRLGFIFPEIPEEAVELRTGVLYEIVDPESVADPYGKPFK